MRKWMVVVALLTWLKASAAAGEVKKRKIRVDQHWRVGMEDKIEGAAANRKYVKKMWELEVAEKNVKLAWNVIWDIV